MRFCLSQLHVWHPSDAYPQWSLAIQTSQEDPVQRPVVNGNEHGIRGHLTQIRHLMEQKRTPTGIRHPVKAPTTEEMTVTGQYISHQAGRPSKKVILWIYGGAYLAGDSIGNIGIAEKMGMLAPDGDGMPRDVFVPDYRLVPENHLDDAVHDITLAFEYLVYKRGVQAEDIVLVGVSSGGGLVALLLQALAKAQRQFNLTNCVAMPAGGVMMGPFVDYTEPKGSMKEFIRHDLIVNQVCMSTHRILLPFRLHSLMFMCTHVFEPLVCV